MTFPHVDRSGTHPFIITGRRVREDGSYGCFVGYHVRHDRVEWELARLADLDRRRIAFPRDENMEPLA